LLPRLLVYQIIPILLKIKEVEKILNFTDQLNNLYPNFKEERLKTRRFKHADVKILIENLKSVNTFQINISGNSTEGLEIYLIRAGKGKIKVFLWSQMHGDEATATAALFDIFIFLSQKTEFQSEIRTILENLELYFVPMVNPDGAEVYKRRNALDIDINRDAARLETVESKLLKNLIDQIKPEYGFNLHDQETYYTAGLTKYPATMSFLAPSFNKEKEIDEKRLKSIQQIILINQVLQKFIPNCIGRYNDDFMPTAFGDNVQFWGTSTILFESGGYYADPEKQTARKMNFIAIISSLFAIANNTAIGTDVEKYFQIPENKKDKLHDLIIRNAIVKNNGREFKMDIAIRIKEINSPDFKSFEPKGEIADLGDLTYFYGYSEIDAKGLFVADIEQNILDSLKIGMKADFCLLNSDKKLIYKVLNGIMV
jgi:hypothetical protein